MVTGRRIAALALGGVALVAAATAAPEGPRAMSVVANPDGRVFPRLETEAAYGPFFARLREIGCTGGVSSSVVAPQTSTGPA